MTDIFRQKTRELTTWAKKAEAVAAQEHFMEADLEAYGKALNHAFQIAESLLGLGNLIVPRTDLMGFKILPQSALGRKKCEVCGKEFTYESDGESIPVTGPCCPKGSVLTAMAGSLKR